jgi:hypothetical protein
MHSDPFSQQTGTQPPSGLPPVDPEVLAYWAAPAAAGPGHPPAQAGSWVGTQHQPPADPAYAPWAATQPQPPADQAQAPWAATPQQTSPPWAATPEQAPPPWDTTPQQTSPPWAATPQQAPPPWDTTPQQAAAPPWAGAPQQAPWAGAPHQPPPYLVIPTAEPGRAAPGRRTGPRAAVILAAALTVLGGSGAYAADTWAKGEVCDAVRALSKSSAPAGGKAKSAVPTKAEVEAAGASLETRARLLFFHADLRDATHGLAGDLASIARFAATAEAGDPDAAGFTERLAVAASIESHAREAQRACGLPVRSLFTRKTK